MQEFLVIIVIALAIFFLPRLMGGKPAPEPKGRSLMASLTGWMRLAILITVFWIVGCAVYLRPWAGDTLLFFCIGLGPAAVLWGGAWVWTGYKKYQR
jgi:hypothetical protein